MFLSISTTAGSGLKRVSESCCCKRLVLGSLSSCQALFTGSELLSVVVRLILTVKPVIEAEAKATKEERRAHEPRVFRSSLSGPKWIFPRLHPQICPDVCRWRYFWNLFFAAEVMKTKSDERLKNFLCLSFPNCKKVMRKHFILNKHFPNSLYDTKLKLGDYQLAV